MHGYNDVIIANVKTFYKNVLILKSLHQCEEKEPQILIISYIDSDEDEGFGAVCKFMKTISCMKV